MSDKYTNQLVTWLTNSGFRHQTGTYRRIAASGIVQYHRFYCAEADRNTLIVHGTGNDGLFPFARLIKTLLESGSNVITFDIDGHGKHSSTLLDWRVIGSCIPDAFTNLDLDEDLPLQIVGHSLGGHLALHATASHSIPPPTLLSIIGTPVRISVSARSGWQELLSIFSRDFLGAEDTMPFYTRLPAIGPFKRKQFPIRSSMRGFDSIAYINSVARYFEQTPITDKLASMSLPLELIYGSKDLLAPPSHGELIQSRTGNANLVILEGATHLTSPLVLSARKDLQMFQTLRDQIKL